MLAYLLIIAYVFDDDSFYSLVLFNTVMDC